MTTFLKFDSEEQAIEVLAKYRNEDQWQLASHDHALDIIGTIYKQTGETQETEMGSVPVMAPIDGFHVNFIGELPEEALPFVVQPTQPMRVFA